MRPSVVSPYGIRTMAKSSRDDDKSWGEVAGEAAGALKYAPLASVFAQPTKVLFL